MAEISYSGDRDEDDLIEEIRDNIKRSNDHQKDWRDLAVEDFDYTAGRQYTTEELSELEEDSGRPAITFNRIEPVVSAVHGHQLSNQQDIKCLPREQGDDQFAEVYSAAIKWADDESDALDDISEAFLDLIISGMGWTETYLSYDEDPDGKLHTAAHVPCLEMGWDPNAKNRNISDARYIYRNRWWKRKEAEQKWPKLRDLVLRAHEDQFVRDAFSEEHNAQEAWKYEHDVSKYYQPHKDEVRIVQYQWWEHKPMYRVMDRQNGRIVELSPSKFEKMREFLDMQQVPYVKQMKRTYYQAFMAGDHLLEKEKIDANEFTFKCMTGKRDNNKNYWFGIVRGMKDPQRWSNKFFSEMQDFMASNRRGGAFAEETAFTNVRKAEEDWNRNDALILLADNGISKIQERQQINYPQGLDRLMEIAIAAIPDTSGINLEMMGLVDRNQPGVLESQRKRASINILSTFFSSMKKYQQARGRLALFFIREYLSDGRMIRILGEEGAGQYIPLIRNPNHDVRYDIIVDEAPHSVNQKEETFAVIMQLMPFLSKMGIPPPPQLMNYLPLPKSLVTEWQQSMQKSQQAAQNDPRKQAETADIASRAEKNKAEAQKKLAEAQREAGNISNDDINAIANLTR